jgi:hypothetical protein
MQKTPFALSTIRNFSIFILFLLLFAGKCNRGYRKIAEENERREKVAEHMKALMQSIHGIGYTEVKRTFDNGLSFSPVGYQLVPEWRVTFNKDSVNIFSPKKNRFLNAPLVFDHDSVFNIAWAWLKLRYVKKDSIQFMVLHVNDRLIEDEKVHVYMTFYTNDYIKNVLHSDTNQLRRPSRRDTEYIKAKTLLASRIPDSAFAGTQPAILKSKSPLLTVSKKVTPVDDVSGGKTFDDYLSPTYNITIHRAYTDFGYTFTAFVDEKGAITFRKSLEEMSPEFKDSIIATMKAITDGYLKLYLDVIPGKTLGIPHNSIIFLNVSGYKK